MTMTRIVRSTILPLLIASAMVCIVACEDDYEDHDIPVGQGALVLDNLTGYDLVVFVDGSDEYDLDAGDDQLILDVDPGLHRVVFLNDDDGVMNLQDEYDVLSGRYTILDISVDANDPSALLVSLEFDD